MERLIDSHFINEQLKLKNDERHTSVHPVITKISSLPEQCALNHITVSQRGKNIEGSEPGRLFHECLEKTVLTPEIHNCKLHY